MLNYRAIGVIAGCLTLSALGSNAYAVTCGAVVLARPGDACYAVEVNTITRPLEEGVPGSLVLFSLAKSDSSPVSLATPISNIFGGATASATSANNGTLLLSASAQSRGYGSSTNGIIQYLVSLVPKDATGPADSVVPLHVTALAQSFRNSSTNVFEEATFLVQQFGSNLIYKTASRPLGRVITMFNVNQWINIVPYIPFTVYLAGSAQASAGGGVDRVVSTVMVDPIFVIDPVFASRYTLVGLPIDAGTDPVPAPDPVPSPVPLPASLAMLLGGVGMLFRRKVLALLGMTLRRADNQTADRMASGVAVQKHCMRA